MKKYLSLLFVAFMALLCFSCHNDEGSDVMPETKDKSISFSLQLGNDYASDSRTRVGTDYETMVDENNINVLIYDGSTCVGKVENIELTGIVDNLGVYVFKGSVNKGILVANKKYRFMVIANCSVPSDAAKQQNTVYERSNIGKWIPMWGVTSYTVNDNTEQYLNSVSLIRAVAKIEVKLTKDLYNSGYRIKKVSINNSNSKGYAFPKNWLTMTESVISKDCFNALDNIENTIEFKYSKKGNHAVIYVPEYDNKSNPANAAKLTVVLTDIDGNELAYNDYVEFKDYDIDGRPIDNTLSNIERNVFYQYTIKSIGNELGLEAALLPWNCIEESWDYTDHISINEEGKLKWIDGTYATIDNATSTVVLKPSVNLRGSFTIDSPVGSKWFATFIPVTGMNNSFVFKINGKRTASGNVGEKATLTIEPVHGEVPKNNVAKLRIVVVTPDGRVINVKELLPKGFIKDEYTIIQTK